MGKAIKSGPTNQMLAMLSGGRTLDEQIEWLRKYANHGLPLTLRALVMNSNGIPMPKEKAENAVIFGCYIPFTSPFLINNIIKLLNLLEIDYSSLEQEFCCGAPLLLQTPEKQRNKTMAVSKEMSERNLSQAVQKGAKTMAYCCVGCSYTANAVYPDDSAHHLYIYDLILDKMEKKTLKVPKTVMGYFEGCHTDYKVNYPGVSLNWKRYRQFLDKIKGLKVVDFSNKFCCKKAPDKIIGSAEKQNLDTILCSCNGCYGFLGGFIGGATKGKIKAMSFPEILLKSLGN